MAEEALVLRLPPRIATKLTARLNQQERSRSEGPLFQRRRRKRKSNKSSDVQEKTELASLVEAVWGEEGAPDYDSMDEASGDLLDLVLGEEEEENGEDDNNTTLNNKMEDEDFSSLSNDQIDYWRVTGKEYIFQFGAEQLHATLINLPCVVETQKLTADSLQVYKTGNIGQALVVHDCPASTPRSEVQLLAQEDFVEHTFAHGITPPMHNIAQRFAKNTSQARRNVSSGMQLTIEDISQADERMNDMKELVLAKNKKQDVQPEKQAVRKNAKQQQPGANASSTVIATGSTVFVHEELIDSEPWMEDHPDDVIVVEPGTDRFVTSTKLQQKRARDNFQKKKEEQQRVGNFVQHQQPAMQQYAQPNYIPALANPMEQQHGNMFQRQHHGGTSPPFNYAAAAAQSPNYQQQYSPGTFQQGSPPSYAGSPAYGSGGGGSPSPPEGTFQQSPYGMSSHQSPMLSAGSPTAAATGDAAHQDPMLRVQELRRKIARATEEARNLANPRLRMKKEATIEKMQDELRRLEPSVL